jgi:hypothetical protein
MSLLTEYICQKGSNLKLSLDVLEISEVTLQNAETTVVVAAAIGHFESNLERSLEIVW